MKNKRFTIILVLYLLLCIGNNLIHPITTPFLVNELCFDKVFFGYYYALMSFGVVIGSLVCGILSNKVSRKTLICIGFVGYALFQLFFGTINFNPYIVMVWRFLSGFFVAFPNTLFVVFAADMLPKEERIKGLTLMSVFNLIGVSLGYEIGGVLHDVFWSDNYLASFILQVVWSIMSAVLCFVLVDNKKQEKKQNNSFIKVLSSLDVKQVIFFIALFIFSVASIGVSKYFEPFFQSIDNQKFSSSDLAHFTLLSNGVSIVVILFLIPIIKKKLNKQSNILFTILLLVSAILIFVTFSNRNINVLTVLLFSVYLIYIIAKNLMTPLEQNIAIENVEEDKFSSLLSFRQSILSFGQVVGPLVLASAFSFDMHLPFYISAILYLVSFVLMLIYLGLIRKANKDL